MPHHQAGLGAPSQTRAGIRHGEKPGRSPTTEESRTMQPANAVPGTSAAAHPLQPQPVAPSPGNNASPSQPLLYQACRDGDVATVMRLLAAGSIAVNAIDPDTRLTPLMLASWHDHDDVVFMLTR